MDRFLIIIHFIPRIIQFAVMQSLEVNVIRKNYAILDRDITVRFASALKYLYVNLAHLNFKLVNSNHEYCGNNYTKIYQSIYTIVWCQKI